MSFIKRPKTSKITIDLAGPQGNAFYLLGICSNLAKQLGLDWESIEKDATLGDYEYLLNVLDKNFGAYIDFIR